MRAFQRLTVCTLSLGLVACSSDRLEKGAVAEEWSRSTEQLSIRPIFPPRANFEVGDLYVVRAAKSGAELKTADYYMSSIWFDRMSLENELKKAAPHIKPAKTIADDSGKTKVMSVPDLFVPDTTTRINSLVAFPGFTFASLAESQLGLGVTNSSIAALFGGARKSAYSVSYSVPVAETYGVKYADAHLAVDDYISHYRKNQREKLQEAVVALENSSTKRDKNASSPVLVLVTQVYLARSLDVVISSTESAGGQFSAVTRALTDLDERKTALEKQVRALKGTDSSKGTSQSGAAADVPKEGAGQTKPAATDAQQTDTVPAAKQEAIDQKQAELDTVNEEIRQRVEAVTPAMPGVTGSIVKSSATGVTLRQVFEYPVAIGFSGININIDEFLASGKVAEVPNIVTYPLKREIKFNLE
ncbi:hypothetical protein [Pseudomonas sp. H1h]|uniref:hypothetical protein n=1 Tax=Pseudomonas sp. H1h TaxID=1397280 RepID=UPI00046A6D39|nr:hypothetical protein [Pseudomonas sp. H1h]